MEQPVGQHPTNDQTPSTPQQNGAQTPSMGEERAPMGPVIAAIVVVAVLAIGGLYYWGTKANQEAQQEASSLPATQEEVAPAPEDLEEVSDSTDINTIESELNFDTENLDAELQNIDAELQF